jgi:predicted deacylase
MNNSLIFIIILFVLLTSCFITDKINIIEPIIIDSGIPGPTLLLIAGTHGNEPAGTIGLESWAKSDVKPSKGKIIIISRVNKIGLFLCTRYGFNAFFPIDYNRNYPSKKFQPVGDFINYQVAKYVFKADFIIDFHEGWGFSNVEPESMGSGIYPSNTDFAMSVGNKLLTTINNTIENFDKKFTISFDSPRIPNTLDAFASAYNKNYILIETSGQNDIQPMDIRVSQVLLIVNEVLGDLGMK